MCKHSTIFRNCVSKTVPLSNLLKFSLFDLKMRWSCLWRSVSTEETVQHCDEIHINTSSAWGPKRFEELINFRSIFAIFHPCLQFTLYLFFPSVIKSKLTKTHTLSTAAQLGLGLACAMRVVESAVSFQSVCVKLNIKSSQLKARHELNTYSVFFFLHFGTKVFHFVKQK